MSIPSFLLRKTVHAMTGVVIAWLLFELPYPQVIIAAFLAMVIVLASEYVRITDSWWRRVVRSVLTPFMRQKEHSEILGPAWLSAGAFLTSLIAFREASVCGMLVWAFADPAGEIGGKLFHGPHLYRKTRKTWAGSIAVFVVATLVVAGWFAFRGTTGIWWQAALIGFVAASIEASSDLTRIDDNLSLPLAAAVMAALLIAA